MGYYLKYGYYGTLTPCLSPSSGADTMTQTYTAVIRQSDEWWIGCIKEVRGVNGQAHTREELLEDLKSALAEMIEINSEDALLMMEGVYEEVGVSA